LSSDTIEYRSIDELINTIEEYIDKNDFDSIKKIVSELDGLTLIELLNNIDQEYRLKIIPFIDLLRIGSYINRLNDEILNELESYKGILDFVELINWLPVDEAVDLIQRLNPRLANQVLKTLSAGKAREIISLLKYPPESVGGVMTTRIPVFRRDLRVESVINEYVKKSSLNLYDRHYYIYVVDENNKLIGCVDVKSLLLIDRSKTIGEVVSKPRVTINPDRDREEAARLAIKYDLLELPVVDYDGRLLGIITLDDLLDVLAHELSEDLMKHSGFIRVIKSSYTGTSIKEMVKRRAPPIISLYIANTITAGIVASFTNVIERVAILASFLTMLADNSGNIGSQISSLIIRGLALGEFTISLSDFLKILRKEVLTILLMIITLIPVGFTISFTITYLATTSLTRSLIVGLIVSIALAISSITSDLIGSILPLILGKLGIDPASASSPLITTIGDIISAFIYFIVALSFIDALT